MEKSVRNGLIDGHDMGIYQAGASDFQGLTKYLTVCNYSYENYIFVANTKIFERLEPKTQTLLKEKTKIACEWGKDLLENREKEMKKIFIENNVEIVDLSPEETAVFKEKTRPLIEKLKAKYGEEACRAFGITKED